MQDDHQVPYPWQHLAWSQIDQYFVNDRVPHALLFYGHAGLGKLDFVFYVAKRLLCQNSSKPTPCGNCQSCRIFSTDHHPDFLLIQPELDKSIKVDDIRLAIDFMQQSKHTSPKKILVINGVDRSTLSASNALLKILEEPIENAYLFLTATVIDQIPATILSRCQKIFFPPVSEFDLGNFSDLQTREDFLQALDLTGSPLLAREMIETDRISIFRQFQQQISDILEQKAFPLEIFDLVKSIRFTMVLHWECYLLEKLIASTMQNKTNFDLFAPHQFIRLEHCYYLLDEIYDALRKVTFPLNQQLILEKHMLGWQAISKRI